MSELQFPLRMGVLFTFGPTRTRSADNTQIVFQTLVQPAPEGSITYIEHDDICCTIRIETMCRYVRTANSIRTIKQKAVYALTKLGPYYILVTGEIDEFIALA